MRLLFIHRNSFQDPLGFMYLAAVLRQRGHWVRLIDVAYDPDWEERAQALKPDAVGYSVITGSHGLFLEINRRLKDRMDFLSIWGGPHPTFFPEFIDEPGVDLLCLGEGERAVVELAEAFDRGEPLEDLANLHVKTERGVVRNPVGPLIEDLDSLPFPDRSILTRYPAYRYATSRAVMASRGCPYGCTFCFNQNLRRLNAGQGRYVRHRGVESVIAECRRHREDPWVEQILFKDDLFAHDEGFVRGFADRYAAEVGLPFSCNLRPDRITEQMADDLARAGAKVVHFGVESGSERIRREILRRQVRRQAMIDTARWFRERGVRVYTYNMVGIPGETLDEALETLELNAEIKPDIAMVSLFQPYPRTPLGDRAVELGWTEPGYQSFDASMYRGAMPNMPHRRERLNMVRLFPLASRFPGLRRLVPSLLGLPLTPAYSAADFLYKATRFVLTLGLVEPRDVALQSAQWTFLGRRRGM